MPTFQQGTAGAHGVIGLPAGVRNDTDSPPLLQQPQEGIQAPAAALFRRRRPLAPARQVACCKSLALAWLALLVLQGPGKAASRWVGAWRPPLEQHLCGGFRDYSCRN